MKLDYKFIKQILITMEEYENHEIKCQELLMKLELLDLVGKIDDNKIDPFIGHIKLLGDNYLIESSSQNFGFMRTNQGYMIGDATYRITAQGYEFLDVLKNDNVFNKVKNLAIPTALEVGKQLLVQFLTGQLK